MINTLAGLFFALPAIFVAAVSVRNLFFGDVI